MPTDTVLPVNIRLAGRLGEIVHQDFVVQRPLPNGALVATIVDDDSVFRLREFVAFDFVRVRLTDEPPFAAVHLPRAPGNDLCLAHFKPQRAIA